MSKQFGEYIHLHWQNYYDHGTFRNQSKQSDFSNSLFSQHRNNIRLAVEKQKIPSLALIEQQYNTQNEEAWKFFKEIDSKTYPYRSNVLAFLLQSVNSTWTNSMITHIVNNLEWHNDRQTFVYNPKVPLNKFKYKSNVGGLPALKLDTSAAYHWIDTVKKYIKNSFLPYLKSLKETEGSTQMIANDEKILGVIWTELIRAQKILAKQEMTEKLLSKQLKGGSEITKNITGSKNKTLKKWLEQKAEEINKVREKYLSVEEINKQIQSAIAEICGNIAAKGLSSAGVNIIKNEIQKAISVGRTGSDSMNISPNMISLNVKELEAIFQDSSLEKVPLLKENGVSKDGHVRYNLTELGQSRSQKRDVELSIGAEEYGISVKNTKFADALSLEQAQQLGNEKLASTIALQDSSLLLYLLGMDYDTKTKGSLQNLGTHYLNVLSQHPDTSITDIQKQALSSLKFYILYSAMTGQGQLRTSGFANILAVYDKTKKNGVQRIHLFDMSDILLKLESFDFKEGVSFSPALTDSFLFKNNEVKDDNIQKAISQRLTSIIMQARQTNIAASLYTTFLRDKI